MLQKENRSMTLNIEREKRLSFIPDDLDEDLERALKKTALPEDFGDKVADEFEQQLKSGKLDKNFKSGIRQTVAKLESESKKSNKQPDEISE